MDPAQLKQNVTEQIEKTEVQIRELEENLAKAKEYKLKLTGGLETLGLLEEKPPEDTPAVNPDIANPPA